MKVGDSLKLPERDETQLTKLRYSMVGFRLSGIRSSFLYIIHSLTHVGHRWKRKENDSSESSSESNQSNYGSSEGHSNCIRVVVALPYHETCFIDVLP
jgi:hypothetical protein